MSEPGRVSFEIACWPGAAENEVQTYQWYTFLLLMKAYGSAFVNSSYMGEMGKGGKTPHNMNCVLSIYLRALEGT